MLSGFTSLRKSSILIKNGEIINAYGKTFGDILIEDGIIKEIGKGLRRNVDFEINASGFAVLPGVIDIHFHIREPGHLYGEDIRTGTLAAVHGGITSLFMMPNTEPPIDTPEMVSSVKKLALEKALARIFIVGCATQRREGRKIAEYGLMMKEGIISVSDDGNPITSSFAARKSLEYAKTFGLIVIEHAEDKELSGDANEGVLTAKYGLTPYPTASEDIIVARDIILVELTGGKLHFTHVSSGRAMEMIKEAKSRGLDITCDVTPHHIIFCDEDIEIYNTNLKVNPPIRSKRDREKLIEGILDGAVSAIASDHAPHPDFLKQVDFSSAPPGISSADFFLPILYFSLVDKGIITFEKLVELISFNPARRFGIPAGEIKEGKLGDIVIFSPDEKYTITKDMIFSKGKNSPYINWRVKGKVKYTIVAGNICYSDSR